MWCLAQSTWPWQLVVLQSGPRCNLSASRFELLEGQEAGWQPVPIGLVAAGSIHLRLRATDYGQSSAVILPGEQLRRPESWHRLQAGSCLSTTRGPAHCRPSKPVRVEEGHFHENGRYMRAGCRSLPNVVSGGSGHIRGPYTQTRMYPEFLPGKVLE